MSSAWQASGLGEVLRGTAAGAPAASGADGIVRGVIRLLVNLDYRPLTEFSLPDGRRADVAAVDAHGSFAIVEVKSSISDFRADGKWTHYRSWCDRFFFGVDPQFPKAMLPRDVGLIVADRYEGAVLRPATVCPLNAARRRALLVRFARTASGRLTQLYEAAGAAGRPAE